MVVQTGKIDELKRDAIDTGILHAGNHLNGEIPVGVQKEGIFAAVARQYGIPCARLEESKSGVGADYAEGDAMT